MTAVIALIEMPAQRGGAADGQFLQDSMLVVGEPAAALPMEFGAVAADDVGDLERRVAVGDNRPGRSAARASKGLAVLRRRDTERWV